MSNKKQFDLNDLITEEDLTNVDAAAQKIKQWEDEVEWRRVHDPNFEKWYADECQKIHKKMDDMTIHMTQEELYEKYGYCKGL